MILSGDLTEPVLSKHNHLTLPAGVCRHRFEQHTNQKGAR
jgi:hypothetical protein